MIVSTTPTVDGREIGEYIRVVAGETIVGINALKDFAAGFRNIVGGRSQGYEQEAATAREQALGEMVQRATALGAEGVVGVSIEYAVLGQGNMLLVAATGTAVRFR